MTPWANIWKTAPFSPSTVSVESPRPTMPMCETLE